MMRFGHLLFIALLFSSIGPLADASPSILLKAIQDGKTSYASSIIENFIACNGGCSSIKSSQLDLILHKYLKKSKVHLKTTGPTAQKVATEPQLQDDGNFDLEATDEYGNTALMLAIEKRLSSVTSQLISIGTNLNHKNSIGNTPLILALQTKQPKVVHELLEAGADSQAVNKKNESALHWSIAWPNQVFFERILANGADPNLVPTDGLYAGVSPVILAASQGSKPIVELLKRYQNNLLDVHSKEGENLLHLAARVPSKDLLGYLLEENLDPSLPNRDGYTPLMIAAESGHCENIEVLLQNEATLRTLEIENGEGNTAFNLYYFNHTKKKNFLDCAALMVSAGANFNHRNPLGLTPVWSSIKNSEFSQLNWLIGLGIKLDLRSTDENGKNILLSLHFKGYHSQALARRLGLANDLDGILEVKKQSAQLISRFKPWKSDSALLSGSNEFHELNLIKNLAQTTAKSILFETQEARLLKIVEVNRTCIVCGDAKVMTEHQALGPADCACFLCTDCSPHYLNSLLHFHEGRLSLCPGCKGLVRSNYLNRNHIPEADIEKFLVRQIQMGNARLPNWIPCRTEDCIGGKAVLPGQSAYYTCASCDFSGCLECGNDHLGTNCKAQGADALATQKRLEKLIELGRLAPKRLVFSTEDERYFHGRFRPCYYCGVMTERLDGCNSMNCVRCGKKWHWNHGNRTSHDFSNEPQSYEPLFPAHF